MKTEPESNQPDEQSKLLIELIRELFRQYQIDNCTIHGVLNTAKSQLEKMKPGLKLLLETIEREKPEYVALLDRGARMFGTPLHRYLKTLGLENPPKIVFYNDDNLKKMSTLYHHARLFPSRESKEEMNRGPLPEGEFEHFVTEEFQDLKHKKILFVDETCNDGKGGIALFEAGLALENEDLIYCALSTVRLCHFGEVPAAETIDNYAFMHGKKFKGWASKQEIGPIPFTALIPYVSEDNVPWPNSLLGDRTKTIRRDYADTKLMQPYERGMTPGSRHALVKQIKDMIYQTLMELPR